MKVSHCISAMEWMVGRGVRIQGVFHCKLWDFRIYYGMLVKIVCIVTCTQ